MYVQKKMMAKLEQERVANQQQQLNALKQLTSIQQINSAQHQQQQLTAFLAAMMNKNFLLNQQQQTPLIQPKIQTQTNTPASVLATTTVNNTVNCTVNNKAKTSNHQISRKRSHSDLDAFSSEEEPYCYAKMRQPPSLGKKNSSSKVLIGSKVKLDQNNNSMHCLFQETSVSTTSSPDQNVKHYDSGHSDDEELNSKKQSKRGRNYRKMMIEKRRRDRINNSLNELRRLVPAAFEKQGSAKLEKAEILQRTVIYLKSLHAKGFDTFSLEPAKFALDYHTIGFTECVNETARYLTNNEEIDDLVNERVITHLKAQLKNELAMKDGLMTLIPANNHKIANDDHQQQADNLSTENSSNKKIHRTPSPSKQQQIKIEPNPIINQAHNNLLNLHNSIPSPPSSSVSPLSTSSQSSLNPVTASSESDSSQIYSHIPYTLLKNKILSYNNSPVQPTNTLCITQSSAILTNNHHNLNSFNKIKCL